jgi:probable phosphoglycerate mutase
MKHLMFVRHGRVDRPEGVYPPEDSITLSAHGANDLRRLQSVLAMFNPDRIVASATRRCRESVAVLCSGSIAPLDYDERLRERVLTQLVGWTSGQIRDAHGQDFLDRLEQGTDRVYLAGEESLPDAADRVMACISAALALTPGRLLVVSHGGPHSWVCCRFFGLDLEALRKFSLYEAHYSLFELTDNGCFQRLLRMNCIETPENRL